jgi:hypothetical protein
MSPRDRTRRQPTQEDTIRATRRAQALTEIDAVGIFAEQAGLWADGWRQCGSHWQQAA